MRDIIAQYRQDGYAVIENFLLPSEVTELRNSGLEFTENLPIESERRVFSAVNPTQEKENYFLDSADKISLFFEQNAVDEKGQLLVDPKVCLNKVGHALHVLHPIFRKYTFDERVKEVCYQLGYKDPGIPQSMYIYKNPGLGSEVISHQDASYLYTEPESLIGFWIALDDATIENGCLWAIPGSHKGGVHRRFYRNPDSTSPELVIYDKPAPVYQKSAFTAVPVKKGSCVLIHGRVVHRSEHNKSSLPRHAYTFHVVEQDDTKYASDNWLQLQNNVKFPSLYRIN